MKIVIIDDDPESLALVRAALQNMDDHQIIDFLLPTEALAWCIRNDLDLVIVDCMMPKLDGMAFIRQFRALEGKANKPILMISSRQEKHARYQALAFGSTDFLTKPLDINKFYDSVKNLLANHLGR